MPSWTARWDAGSRSDSDALSFLGRVRTSDYACWVSHACVPNCAVTTTSAGPAPGCPKPSPPWPGPCCPLPRWRRSACWWTASQTPAPTRTRRWSCCARVGAARRDGGCWGARGWREVACGIAFWGGLEISQEISHEAAPSLSCLHQPGVLLALPPPQAAWRPWAARRGRRRG